MDFVDSWFLLSYLYNQTSFYNIVRYKGIYVRHKLGVPDVFIFGRVEEANGNARVRRLSVGNQPWIVE